MLNFRFLAVMLLIVGTVHADDPPTASDIFLSRVLPLLNSKDGSSCQECHFQGVQLSEFINSDQAASFASLRARGWIDEAQPEKSKLLSFVHKSGGDTSDLIKKVRTAETEALTAWIRAAVKDPSLLSHPLPKQDDLKLSEPFIRHHRMDSVMARFSDSIWSQLERCANCHSPQRNQKQVEKHGEQMSWIVPQRPVATLRLLTERKLIDLDNPAQSEIRTKPLGLVEHGGGPKFVIDGPIDMRWREFLVDYAKLVRGGYEPSEIEKLSVPNRRSWLSPLQLRITGLPEAWRGHLLIVTLHPRDPNGTWLEDPVAVGESPVNPKQLIWQNSLTIFQTVSQELTVAERVREIPVRNVISRGLYQVRLSLAGVAVDQAMQPVAGQKESPKLIASAEIEAPWPPGYQPPRIMEFREFVAIPSGL